MCDFFVARDVTRSSRARAGIPYEKLTDVDASAQVWPFGCVPFPIASILHRDTIQLLVGAKTHERGRRVFEQGRVLDVESRDGSLLGRVRPTERTNPYAVRIWVKDDGLVYSCTCPVGVERQFCKHAVAVALAHIDRERRAFNDRLEILRRALGALSPNVLVEQLVQAAQEDVPLQMLLAKICVDHMR